MNAPWRPGGHMRDPFNAFVCDEATYEIVRGICIEMGWPPEKVNRGGLRNAVQSLSVSASPAILFVDMSESGDPLNDINGLAEVCEPGTVVIAAGQVNDVRLYRDLLSSGIQDYLLKPFGPDQFREVLVQAQAVFAAPREGAGSERPHMTAAIIGTRGGAGASTIATSLAWLMSAKAGRMTALLDLDVHFGTGALAMDLEPGRGLTDAIENPGRIDGLFIERAMVRANDKLALLSAEAPINQPLLTDGSAFFQLQEEFRAAFECSVIDLPRNMLIQYPHLMNDANVAVIVTELTLAAARDSIRILSWMKGHAPHCKVIVAANRVHATMLEISRKDFEQSIEREIDVLIPYDLKTAAQAAKLGKTFAEVAKGSKAGVALTNIMKLAFASVEESADETPGAGKAGAKGGSLLDRITDLKSIMAKKKMAKATA